MMDDGDIYSLISFYLGHNWIPTSVFKESISRFSLCDSEKLSFFSREN